MKKEKTISNKKKMLITSVLSFNVLVCVVGLTIAWFVDNMTMSVGSEASINKSYFEGGNGTANNPYLIKYPRQYYFFTWLQDMGYFNEEDLDHPGTYKQTYFKLHDGVTTLDMSGYLLPPIGTDQYPFIGSFDGNGKTISNLNITNNPAQYTNEPLNPNSDDRNYQIMGAFGVVGSYGTMPYTFSTSTVQVKNLIINNATVNSATPKENKTLMGIAVGYLNDVSGSTLSNIKVSGNSTITSAVSTPLSYTTNLSDYALVGYSTRSTARYVQDVDIKVPEITNATSSESSAIIQDEAVAGGDLVIAPSGLTDGNGHTLYGAFGSNVNSGEREVAGSTTIPDSNPERKTAYYRATVTSTTPSPQPKTYRIYTGAPVFNGSFASVEINNGNSVTASDSYSTDEGFESFMHYKGNSSYRVNSTLYGLHLGDTASFQGTYPTNCIWFKPLNAGHCFVSFGITTKSSDAYSSIFRYKRTPNGSIDTNTLQELELHFNRQLGNGTVVLFDINITDTTYEYCIARNSADSGQQAYFFFLKLAGTDSQGGTTIHHDVDASKHAIYEQTELECSEVSSPSGVGFAGDALAAYQLSAEAQTTVFTSQEQTHTTYTTTGTVTKLPQTSTYGPRIIQTITGIDNQGATTIIMKKITTGSTIEYWYKSESDNDFVESTAAALARYFIPNSPFPELGETSIQFFHQIASGDGKIDPITSYAVTVTSTSMTIASQTITTSAEASTVYVEHVGNVAYSIILNTGSTQIYP